MSEVRVDDGRGPADAPTEDAVNHPSHYTSHPSGVECIQVTRHFTFNIGNVVKYVWRAGLKQEEGKGDMDKHLEDLRKAKFYLEDEIERLAGIQAG